MCLLAAVQRHFLFEQRLIGEKLVIKSTVQPLVTRGFFNCSTFGDIGFFFLGIYISSTLISDCDLAVLPGGTLQ